MIVNILLIALVVFIVYLALMPVFAVIFIWLSKFFPEKVENEDIVLVSISWPLFLVLLAGIGVKMGMDNFVANRRKE